MPCGALDTSGPITLVEPAVDGRDIDGRDEWELAAAADAASPAPIPARSGVWEGLRMCCGGGEYVPVSFPRLALVVGGEFGGDIPAGCVLCWPTMP